MRYYVRQSPNDTIRGPFTIAEIQQMLSRGLLTGAAQALQSTGQTLSQLRASDGWRAVSTLPEVTPADDTAVATPAAQPLDREQRLVYWLLGAGVALVLLEGPIAKLLGTGLQVGDHWVWDTQQLAERTSQVRLLGLMSFAAGLVERLATAIRSRP